jgi:hypothetical protein
MKTPTLNIDELKDVDPGTVLKYLESNGWLKVESKSTSDYIISKYSAQDTKEAFVLLPLDDSIPDFPSRLYDLIKVVAVVEERSQSNVLDSFKSAKEFAEEIDRDILNFRLKFKNRSQREVPAGGLGKLLTSFQNLVNGIAQSRSGSPTAQGLIPNIILNQSQISVIGSFEGSFGLRIASTPPPKMEQLDAFQKSEPLIREAFKELFDLVKASQDRSNDQLLKETLVKLGKRSASSYRNFLIALSDLKTDNDIEWGSPDKKLGDSIEFPHKAVLRALSIVTKDIAETSIEFEIFGEWIGGNKRQKNFEVKDIANGKTYRGNVCDTALRDIEVPNISQLYNVIILEEPSLNEATQEISRKYTLLKLEKSNND